MWWLLDVLQVVTGKDFHLPEQNMIEFPRENRKQLDRSISEVRVWWAGYNNGNNKIIIKSEK